MYQTLLFLHSIFRWLVLAGLFYALYRAYKGYKYQTPFSKTDNAVRHIAATIAHIQLMLGILLYTQSPIIQFFWRNFNTAIQISDHLFYALTHMLLMLVAVVVITIGSAMAKRKLNDREKFKTMLIGYALALLIILIAIPWPFSPFAHRPILRSYVTLV